MGGSWSKNYVSIIDSNNKLVAGYDIGFKSKGVTRDDGLFYVGADPKGAYDAIAKYILDNQAPEDMKKITVP